MEVQIYGKYVYFHCLDTNYGIPLPNVYMGMHVCMCVYLYMHMNKNNVGE